MVIFHSYVTVYQRVPHFGDEIWWSCQMLSGNSVEVNSVNEKSLDFGKQLRKLKSMNSNSKCGTGYGMENGAHGCASIFWRPEALGYHP